MDDEDPGYPGHPGHPGVGREDHGFPGIDPGSPGISGIDDAEADMMAQPAQPQRASTPALGPDLDKGSSRGRKLPQSDDEYEAPALHRRPWFVGVVSVVVAAAVVVPLILIGSSSGGGKAQDSAAGSAEGKDKDKDKIPPALSPAPTDSASISASPSPSNSPSASASKSASASASPPPAPKPKPPEPSESEGNSEMPKGGVLFVNKKYGFCLDLPGTGKVTANPQAHDGFCTPSTDNQEWLIHPASKGSGTRGADLYLIRNIKSGRCLEPTGQGSAQVTSPVDVAICNASIKEDNQLWWFDKRPNGTYWIRNQKSSDLCLDVARTDQKVKYANATLFGCNAADDHEWSFRKS
ncbi:RICIN domain-containing protein [Streptomyces sp. YC419]|uniref:RICIN domain-containing protein n=1 Tax=Streptomyces ureilyticus TaxID=1775131 RepID=A0ABX0E711_9ACTN|nr:RICIN domain-containing protein [Streptomyces ureilyticus]